MLVILGGAASSPIEALTDEDVYQAFRFPFLAPGARSVAMGGTGAALQDDPGAIWLNPARLASVREPAVILEARVREDDASAVSTGLFHLDPNNPFSGTRFSTRSSPDERAAPSLIAYAQPLTPDSPVVLGVSRAVVWDLSTGARSATITRPANTPIAPSTGDDVTLISQGDLKAELDIYDVAAGWKITPTFAIGGGVSLGRLDLSARTVGSLADPLQFTVIGTFDPRFPGTGPIPLVRTVSDGTDLAWAFSFGAYWKPIASLTVATAFRGGPRFELSEVSEDLSTGARRRFSNVLKVPDSAILGLGWTPLLRHPSPVLQTLTIAFDLQRVEYSDLLEKMRAGENILTSSDFVSEASYSASDAVEAHLGAELRRPFASWSLALRGGIRTEREGVVHLTGVSADAGALQGRSRALKQGGFFSEGDTAIHGTVGFGARFYNFSLDASLDVADPATQASVSATYVFR